MDEVRGARLAEVMAAVARRDPASVVRLYLEFGRELGAALRRELRRMGVDRVDADDLNGLVVDACFVLFDCGAAWDPAGGASPWRWAGHRLRAIVAAWVGQHADVLDLDALAAGAPAEPPAVLCQGDEPELDVLCRLARTHRRCALVLEALEQVATERDRAILLEVRGQAMAGDPSPAVTVARRHGLSDAAVRQVVRRVRGRLADLAAREPRFSPLADLAIVGDDARRGPRAPNPAAA